MRALQLSVLGSVPTLVQVPMPEPGAGQVLVRIVACGLNFADLLMTKGEYQERPACPFILGMECAGIVERLGPDIPDDLRRALAPGTPVALSGITGGLADYGCFPARYCLRIPDSLPFEQAAAFQVVYGTCHLALHHRARLQPGEILLVLGAAGGAGLAAVEIGRLMGARVIASARGAERLAIARSAGADVLIDSEAPGFRDALKALGGVDVVYDPVGGPTFSDALRATRPEGRILVIGFASGDVPPIPANILLVKNITVHGFNWGGYRNFAPQILTDSLSTLLGWLAAGRIIPHVGQILPLSRAADGLQMLRDRAASGKIVIRMDAE